MQNVIAYECPKCHSPIHPEARGWFQCDYCGTCLRIVDEEDGQQYIDVGAISGDRVHRVSHDLVRVIETESQLIRQTIVQEHVDGNEGAVRQANVSYLHYLVHKKEGFEKRVAELQAKTDDPNAALELAKCQKEIRDIDISIEDYECQVDPGRAGRKAREAKAKGEEARRKAREKEREHSLKVGLAVFVMVVVVVVILVLVVGK